MSTTPIDSWAIDLANVTFIYPWVGSEGIMALVAIVLWLLWHVWQVRFEKQEFDNEIKRYGSSEEIKKHLNGDD
jgi:hypothetical protein